MKVMTVTDDTSQPPMSWLKAAVSPNVKPMYVTADTSQALMSWSKAAAL